MIPLTTIEMWRQKIFNRAHELAGMEAPTGRFAVYFVISGGLHLCVDDALDGDQMTVGSVSLDSAFLFDDVEDAAEAIASWMKGERE